MSRSMTRRDFIRRCGYALLSLIMFRALWRPGEEKKDGLKEARFYASGDDLPG